MPWWQIIAILLAFAVVAGLVLGFLASVTGLPGAWATVGVGAATGVVAAILVSRRNNTKTNPP